MKVCWPRLWHILVDIFRCVSISILHKFTDSLTTHGRTLSSTLESITILPLFESMFTQCLKTHLHKVYTHIYTKFTDMFTSCLHHVYTMFEDMFPPNLKNCLHNVRRHVCNIFGNKFKPCWDTCLHPVYTVSTIFEDFFTQCCRTCVQ